MHASLSKQKFFYRPRGYLINIGIKYSLNWLDVGQAVSDLETVIRPKSYLNLEISI